MEIERRLAKVGVVGSNPIARSRFLRWSGHIGRALFSFGVVRSFALKNGAGGVLFNKN